MQISRRAVAFNNAINNPIQRQYAWLIPPWTVIVHRGRKSGRIHRTPVLAFRSGRTLSAAILYGERSDWVQNVLAGGGRVVRGGRTYPLLSPRVAVPDETAELSGMGRRYGRLAGKVLLAELGEPEGRFGRGPRAG